MLLNLVRLKYRESPEFLTIGGIAAQYSFEGSAGAGLTIPEGAQDILSHNGAVKRSEKPTISYAPARGAEFQKGLHEMQQIAGLLGLTIDPDPSKPQIYEVELATEGRIQPAYENTRRTESAPDQVKIHRLPRLADGQSFPVGRADIVISTRSLLEVMFYLSQGISIPHEHMAAGLVTLTRDQAGNRFNWEQMNGDLMRILSCDHCPKNAAVAVKYKGYWFYIDDRDLDSQSTFTLLVEMFGIEVRAGGGGGILYTLNVGG